ncbi:MAG: S8 family serine peptidase [Micropepsaceae bacterium]
MSLSTRAASLFLGTCLLPLAATAETANSPAWVYGQSLEHSDTINEKAQWLVDYDGVTDQAIRVNRHRTRTPPPPTPTPTPSPTPNNTGAGILVGVVDTGIFLAHPEFSGRIAVGGTCFGGTTVCSGAAAQGNDNNGHGTHVAGIIGAAANGTGTTGVAPGVSLLAVKVLDASGSGSYTAVAQGITYAASKGARVISMSLGGSSPSTTLLTPLQTAATSAVIVAAAGNSGNALAPGYPAAYATQAGVVGSMIIVGSVNSSNVISTFSQTPGNGGCVAVGGKTTCFKDVFLVAPGERILSTYLNNGYATMSGTSMATPYVSGVAARVMGASPFLTNKQVVDILFQSATDLGTAGTDAVYGRGLVNLNAALAPLGSLSIATSGSTPGTASGTGEVSGSGISGTLSAGLRNSSIARNAMFFDSFGRDYKTDLTGSIVSSAVSLADVVTQAPWSSQFVSYAANGYSVSGFVSDDVQNSVASLGFTQNHEHDINDMVVRTKLSDSSTMTFGHNASLTGRINQLDLSADQNFTGLFMSASAMNSPYLALSSGGNFASAAVSMGDDLTFSFGHARNEQAAESSYVTDVMADDRMLAKLTQDTDHQRSAQNTVASVNWNFTSWGTAGLTAAYTEEDNSLLGSTEQGALALTSTASTTSVGAGVRFDLGDQWAASASWSMGKTQASPMSGGLVQSFSDIESQAYGLAISKTGVFADDDSVGFAVSRPLHITSGTAVIHASTGVTDGREIIYSDETVALASATPETDFEAGYTSKLSEDTTLQANFIYQQNVAGDSNQDAVAGLVTLKTRW